MKDKEVLQKINAKVHRIANIQGVYLQTKIDNFYMQMLRIEYTAINQNPYLSHLETRDRYDKAYKKIKFLINER